LNILQIFNKYLQLGGEEGSVSRIADSIRKKSDLHTYFGSTAKDLEHPLGKLRMPFLMQKNRRVLDDLRALQKKENFDFWQIHNVFPAISVAVYELAAELEIPIVQYLHNYRFSCVNATFYRDGKVCHDCSAENLIPGIKHGCWRGSRIASLSMAAALRRLWKSGSVNSIKGFIALSESQKLEHLAMGIPADKIEVVHHFLDAENLIITEPKIDGDVLCISRITEEKGIKLLLEAWAKVNSKGRILRIVGDGPELSKLRDFASLWNLDNVVFEGFVPKERHRKLWENATFFVAPSTWLEPFGMVILESWKHKRPVLATNHGSFPEMISHRKDGWLAEPNPTDFAEGLQLALDASENIVSLGKNGHKKLISKYNEEVWCDNIFTAYRKFGLNL
jgi:glycosyltransferase involved in cell wall biosynthesis|tara:strand:- start:8156 stop:9331 length:1176 start_codon:yes stop_codon:yes gene_type:complete